MAPSSAGLMASHANPAPNAGAAGAGRLAAGNLSSLPLQLLPPPLPPPRSPAPGSAVRVGSHRAAATSRALPPALPSRHLVTLPRGPVTALNVHATLAQSSASDVAAEGISLTQPRPDGERVPNEYIDTPLKGGLCAHRTALLHERQRHGHATSASLLHAGSTPLHAETHPHIHISGAPDDHLALVSPLGGSTGHHHCTASSAGVKSCSSKSLAALTSPASASPSLKRLQSTRRSLPITKQPAGALQTLTKGGIGQRLSASHSTCHSQTLSKVASRAAGADGAVDSESALVAGAASVGSSASTTSAGRDSIICPECSRCRCQACRTPRPLPSKWLCHDKFLCSAEACVDYASCLCCVKGLFYHCAGSEGDDDAGATCADRPCSCAPHQRLARWSCLASLTLALPCLACYWPLRGGVHLVEMCYQKCTRHGCRCDHSSPASSSSSSSAPAAPASARPHPPPPSHPHSSAAPRHPKAIVTQPVTSSGKRLLDTD